MPQYSPAFRPAVYFTLNSQNERQMTKTNSQHPEGRELEQYRSVMQTAAMALKAAMVINGGAAIALLTFIGNTKEVSGFALMIFALKAFAGGVVLAAIATGSSFLAQRRYLHEMRNPSERRFGKHITKVSITLVAISYVAFVVGVLLAAHGFGERN